MPELAEIITTTLDGAVKAIETSEAAHLAAYVTAVKGLGGKAATLDDVLKLAASGVLPDYFAATELTLNAQLQMSTDRTRTVDLSGGVTWGPVQLKGDLATTIRQITATNLAVTIVLERQSQSKALSNMFEALSPQGGIQPSPTPLPGPPAPTH